MTTPSVLGTDNESLAMAAYHESIRAFDLDVLELSFPKLRRPKDVEHSCEEPDCRICAPLSQATLEKIRHYAKLMYRLITENEATEHIEDFKKYPSAQFSNSDPTQIPNNSCLLSLFGSSLLAYCPICLRMTLRTSQAKLLSCNATSWP